MVSQDQLIYSHEIKNKQIFPEQFEGEFMEMKLNLS